MKFQLIEIYRITMPAYDISQDDFKRVRKICNSWGGIYCSASKGVPAGFTFSALGPAQEALAELSQLPVEDVL